MKHAIELKVNGEIYEMDVEPRRTLLEVLRDNLGLTGTKEGCDDGNCGTCTVLIDGSPMNSCLLLAVEVQGREIETIEGVATGEELHPVQKAFVELGAIQCGFCTPGMILSAKALLDRNRHPSDDEVKRALSGNFCRCTGYAKIIEAVRAAAGS